MKAIEATKSDTEAPNLSRWLHHAQHAAFRLRHEGPLDASLPSHDQLSQLNMLVQLEHLMSYPIVHDRVSAGTLRLSGWWFDVGAGTMHAHDPVSRCFGTIDCPMAERLTAFFREA